MMDWEYVEAGYYRTYFFRNGYKYKIKKDPYGPTPSWSAYYQWHKWTEKDKWKLVPGTEDLRTKKEAVRFCEDHNRNPRKRYKKFGRVGLERIDRFKMRIYGFFIYKEVNEDGEPISYGRTKYVNPASVGGEDLQARNVEWIRLAIERVKKLNQSGYASDYSQDTFKQFILIAEAHEKGVPLEEPKSEKLNRLLIG